MSDTSILKLIWICGMARCGSMWTFNVARKAIRCAGNNVYPEKVPQSKTDMMKEAQIGMNNTTDRDMWVLKVHGQVNPDYPCSKFIINKRDLRDALVSYRRFMKCDFSRALEAMIEGGKLIQYYESFPNELCLFIKYEDILHKPTEVIRNIAEFVGVSLSEDQIETINYELSKNNVANNISLAHEKIRGKIDAKVPILREEVVVSSPQNWRAYDVNTGFQSGHVSDYREGDWKNILSQKEQIIVDKELGKFL